MAEYKPVTVIFSSKGVDLRTVPDEIAIDEYVSMTNMTSEIEGALRTRDGYLALNTASTGTNVHTLGRLKGKAAAYRYAVIDTLLYRAVTPFTAYPAIFPSSAWIPSVLYKVGDLIIPIGGNRHVYQCTTAGTSGAVQPIFSTVTGSTTADNTVVWTESNFSGVPLLPEQYAVGIDTKPWMFFSDSNLFLKDSGTGSPVLVGIVPPASAAVPVTSAYSTKTIEDFESATPNAYWTKVDPSAVLTLSAETTVKKVGARSLKCAFSGAGIASIAVSKTLDLTTFGPGVSTDDDLIHLYVNTTSVVAIDEFLIQLSLNDTTFVEMYEGAISPSPLAGGVNFVDSTHQDAIPTSFFNQAFNDQGQPLDANGVVIGTPEDLYILPGQDNASTNLPNVYSSYVPNAMEFGSNVWTEFRIKKSTILKIGSTGSTYNWANVKAIRITMKMNQAATLYFDDWTLLGGGTLIGTDYTWEYIYRNSTTGTISNPSPASASPATAPNRNPVVVTVTYSRDPQVDKIDIYRLGGTTTSYSFSGTIPNLPASAVNTVDYTENNSDASLGSELEFDNARPPNFAGLVLHNETLFGWGTALDPANAVRFSKRVNVEQWPTSYLLYVGSGGDKVVRLIPMGEQLFAITLGQVYRIIGTDAASYQAVSTGFNRGMIDNMFAACEKPGSIVMIAFDGAYDFPSGKKLSQPIDGVFHNQTVNGILPINMAALAAIRVAFYDNDLHVQYPSGSAIVNDAEMVFDVLYERWEPSTIAGLTMLAEFDTNTLLIGKSDGFVYQMKTGTTDNGIGIGCSVQTKYLNLGFPDQDKIWGDMALDINTGGQDVYAQLYFNNGDTFDLGITVNTSTRTQVQIPIVSGNSALAINCQLRLTAFLLTAPVTVYKAVFRILLEPPRRRTYVTDWSTDGVEGRKSYRMIMLELDTLGGNGVTVELQLDGSSTTTQTFGPVVTTGRQVVYLAINVDTVGTVSRLKFSQVTDGLTSVFKLYDSKIDALPQPVNPSIWQTEWTDKGYPYDKYWKEILLELNTDGGSRVVEFQVDGVTVQLFSVNANGRQRKTLSVQQDVVGKLARVLITGGETSLYTVDYVVDQEPPDVTIADSLEQTFGFDRYKVLKRAWITLKAPSSVSMKIYADNLLTTTQTIAATSLPSGWEKVLVKLPPNIKGKLLRFVFTSSSAFKIYFEQSEIEHKVLNSEQGYRRYKFAPPQLN